MKRVNNIYNEIVNIERILNMYDKRIRINTKNKVKLSRFEYNYVSNIVYIKNVLEDKSYTPGRYNIFIIKEPKVRLIMSQNVIDKIINHVVSEYFLVRVFDNTLIRENVATRSGKGTHYGIRLLKKYINELKQGDFYILKFDISKYFYNLDHNIIKDILKKKIKDKDALRLLFKIIDSTDYKYVNKIIDSLKQQEIDKILNSSCLNKDKLIKDIENIPEYKVGKGLPIGNMSSQFLAILYLNELDHFIKEKLNLKYYIRYMDDGVILHKDKEYLKYCLNEITKMLDKYKLKLNNKTQIVNCKEGFEFLGFRYVVKNGRLILKIRNQTKRRFKRKMKTMYKLADENKITQKDVKQVENSYLGHLSYGNTQKLIKKNFKNMVDINCIEGRIIDGEIIYK